MSEYVTFAGYMLRGPSFIDTRKPGIVQCEYSLPDNVALWTKQDMGRRKQWIAWLVLPEGTTLTGPETTTEQGAVQSLQRGIRKALWSTTLLKCSEAERTWLEEFLLG